MEKLRKPFWLSKEVLDKIEADMKIDKSRNRSEFLENAVNYYSAYLHTSNSTDIVSEIFVKIFEAQLRQTENRIARMQFKQAVELSKLSHIVSHIAEIDQSTFDKLNAKCVNDVKKNNGQLNFEDAYKYQKNK